MTHRYPTIDQIIGNTPLVALQRLCPNDSNHYLVKLEGTNPAGSVKDRPALNMIKAAEEKGLIKPGDTLIEATSGNTGIALAMVAAVKGYRLILLMPDNMSAERKLTMSVYGAELIEVTEEQGGMEGARDLAMTMAERGDGVLLNQFSNANNPAAHLQSTGPEIWQQTHQNITHFISAMGTTGTIIGNSKYLKAQNSDIQIIGVQPTDGSQIPGIRRWRLEYLPEIFEAERVDRTLDVTQADAEQTARDLARKEGIFCGISSGGAVAAMLRVGAEVENSTLVCIICDRGDRYLSTGVY